MNDKQLLLIMPRFYSYEKAIIEQIQKKGIATTLVGEEPPRIVFLVIRTLQKIFRTKIFYRLFNKMLLQHIKNKKKTYDYLIVIRGNILDESFIKEIKKLLKKNGKMIYYTWDSLAFLEHQGKIANYFDKKYSFDLDDVKNNTEWESLPLFYTKEYQTTNEKRVDYDMACICSLNKFRYAQIEKFQATNPDLVIFRKFYIGRFLFYYKVLTDSFFRCIDKKNIIFTPMNVTEVIEIYLHSKAVLDVTNPIQKGLSMRTIESIGMKKKLVTNNIGIKEYDFYNKKNVFIYNEESLHFPQEWFDEHYSLEEEVYKKYSIENWINTILCCE